jgi:hypothetical protein
MAFKRFPGGTRGTLVIALWLSAALSHAADSTLDRVAFAWKSAEPVETTYQPAAGGEAGKL